MTTLFAVMVFLLLINLGNWQHSRAKQKSLILENFHRAEQLEPKNIQAKHMSDPPAAFTIVKVTGFLQNDKQFLLDNQVFNSQVGYTVFTTLQLENSDLCILINRGFIAQGKTRAELPNILAINNKVTLTGKVDFPSKRSFSFSDTIFEGKSWPSRIQLVKLEQISERLGNPVLPFVLLLDKSSPYIYSYNPRQLYLTPERHKGYAVQWYLLAITWSLLCLWIAIKREK